MLAAVVAAAPLAAQQSLTLRRASAAVDNLDYRGAILLARQALTERLSTPDLVRAYDILGTTYAAMDSARQATDAFQQLILLDPDHEYDPQRVSPKITTLYALALGQVLVIRHLGADTVTFVAGRGALPIRYVLTRTARVRTRIVGPGGTVTVDSSLVEGQIRVQWNGLLAGGVAPMSGGYRVLVEAEAGRDRYAAALPLAITAGSVDTLGHLSALPGYDFLPEQTVPPRSWKPLGLSVLLGGVVVGGSFALEHSGLGTGSRREALVIGGGTLLAGLLASVRRPDPVPAEANIRYNQLVREQLTRTNAEISRDNAARRQQVQLRVTPRGKP
jgi:hypothetical protein